MLLDLIESYLRSSRTSPSRFGREVVNDPRFVFNLQEGRTPRPSTVRRVKAWLAEREKCSGGDAR